MNCKFPALPQCFCSNNDRTGTIRLAKTAYLSLTPEEQLSVSLDLYGPNVREFTETPELRQRKLDELDRELAHLSEDRKKYYIKAVALEKSRLQQDGGEAYVGSEKFRLQFLRAELFDSEEAAIRLAEYFHHKFELFGEEKLACRIQQADLNHEEKQALVSGALTYTGTSDSAGRPVLISRRSYLLYFSVTCIKRVHFYIYQTAVEGNEKAQKRGIVVIGYHVNMPFINPSRVRPYHPVIAMVKHGFPLRFAAFHFYHGDSREHFVLNFILVLLARNDRARFLTHLKRSHQEFMLDIIRFGINPDQLALTYEGDFDYGQICNFWESQRQFEAKSNK